VAYDERARRTWTNCHRLWRRTGPSPGEPTDASATVPQVFEMADSTRYRIRTNLGWALTYNAVAIPLAVTGALNPLLAAFAKAASSLVVVGNSVRSLDSDGSDEPPTTERAPHRRRRDDSTAVLTRVRCRGAGAGFSRRGRSQSHCPFASPTR
jgi:hypothetical protein